MRKHTSTCTSTSHTGQLHALREQAKQGDSGASCSQTGNAADSGNAKKAALDGYVDRVKVTPGQWRKWSMLLAIAFVMNGWSFCTVESPHFKDFMDHVRPNFVLPRKWCCNSQPLLLLNFSCLCCYCIAMLIHISFCRCLQGF